MSAELSSLFRDAGREEAVAAERDFPMSRATVAHYVAAARRRRVVTVVVLAAAAAILIGGGVLGATHWWQGYAPATSPSPSATVSGSSEPSPSATASVEPSASPSASAQPSQSAVPTGPSAATTAPPPPATPVPGPVTGVTAGPGGGSGEVLVDWTAVADATGYRVYRSSSADGPFAPAASILVATGATTVEFGGSYEFIQIWTPSSSSFEYVESVDNVRAYFRVAAFNAGGTGPLSAVVCGSPITAAEGC